MELIDLYNKIASNNIYMCNFKMQNHKARIIDEKVTCIFVDYSQIHSQIEEKEVIAEEVGHYKCNAYYNIHSNKAFIDRQEYKANKWKALNLCPLPSVLKSFKNGNTSLYEISQNLQVNESTLQFAINYYKEQGLIV